MEKAKYQLLNTIGVIAGVLMFVTPFAAQAAIAFDNAGSAFTGGTASPYTVGFTTGSGTNRVLLLSVSTDSSTVSATYAGVSMTQVGQAAPTAPCGRYQTSFYLVAPTSGSNNIVVSFASGNLVYYAASSYTGASQASTPDNHAETTQGTGTTNSNTITPVADNSWHVAFFESGGAGQTASVGTQRTIANGAFGAYDTNAAIHPAGSDTITVNQTNQCGTSNGITIAPFAASTASIFAPFIQLFGNW